MTKVLSTLLYCLFPCLILGQTTVGFHAFVQSSYTHRESLPGARTTASVIQSSLEQLPGHLLKTAIKVEDSPGSPEALKNFLQRLPGEEEVDLSVVYIAGHQSAGGEFEFTGKQKVLWSRLLEGVRIPPHSQRITILDACYAEAADVQSDLVKKMGPWVIFSSSAGEKTFELDLGNRRPVDYRQRYAHEVDWLAKSMGTTSGVQITFLGLMWSRAFLQKAPGPFEMCDWKPLFDRLQTSAEEFRRDRSKKLSSKIVVVHRPS